MKQNRNDQNKRSAAKFNGYKKERNKLHQDIQICETMFIQKPIHVVYFTLFGNSLIVSLNDEIERMCANTNNVFIG